MTSILYSNSTSAPRTCKTELACGGLEAAIRTPICLPDLFLDNRCQMDDCYTFREELALRYPTLGHALWEPDPGGLYDSVAVGDVGFIREGYFCRLFNALRPSVHPPDTRSSHAPNYPPQLELTTPDHIRRSIDNRNDFCSKNISKTTVPHEDSIYATG
jgi:hypothetical protein